jgi:hypothetical protein
VSHKTVQVVISPQEWWPVYEVDDTTDAYCSTKDVRASIPVELLDRYKRLRDEFAQVNDILRRIHTP